MKRMVVTRAALIGATLLAVGCGSDAPTPTTATPSPFIAQVAGVWQGTQALTGTAGGHCTPVLMQSGLVEPLSLAVQQEGHELTARMRSAGTGIACDYKGRATVNNLVLDSSSCEDQLLVVTCTDGSIRDLKLVGSTIRADVRSGVVSGTTAYTYNVFMTGEDQGAGSLQVNYTYSATRR